MPTKNETWRCDRCESIYTFEREAIDCEESHHTIKEIKIKYMKFNQRGKYPFKIAIEGKDGKEHVYTKRGT